MGSTSDHAWLMATKNIVALNIRLDLIPLIRLPIGLMDAGNHSDR